MSDAERDPELEKHVEMVPDVPPAAPRRQAAPLPPYEYRPPPQPSGCAGCFGWMVGIAVVVFVVYRAWSFGAAWLAARADEDHANASDACAEQVEPLRMRVNELEARVEELEARVEDLEESRW